MAGEGFCSRASSDPSSNLADGVAEEGGESSPRLRGESLQTTLMFLSELVELRVALEGFFVWSASLLTQLAQVHSCVGEDVEALSLASTAEALLNLLVREFLCVSMAALAEQGSAPARRREKARRLFGRVSFQIPASQLESAVCRLLLNSEKIDGVATGVRLEFNECAEWVVRLVNCATSPRQSDPQRRAAKTFISVLHHSCLSRKRSIVAGSDCCQAGECSPLFSSRPFCWPGV